MVRYINYRVIIVLRVIVIVIASIRTRLDRTRAGFLLDTGAVHFVGDLGAIDPKRIQVHVMFGCFGSSEVRLVRITAHDEFAGQNVCQFRAILR